MRYHRVVTLAPFVIILVGVILLTAFGTLQLQDDPINVPAEGHAPAIYVSSNRADSQLDYISIATGGVGMRNPSAVYCTEMGYEFQIKKTINGETGLCMMPDGEECDSWSFYSGECGQEYSYCTRHGLDVSDIKVADAFTGECTACVMPNGSIRAVSQLLGLNQKSATGVLTVAEYLNDSEASLDIRGAADGDPLPGFFDWRNADGVNWMTPVKDQGNCGSCWAFSAVGVVEAAYNIGYGNPDLDLNLSEQYLVTDCCGPCGHCCGGWMYTALQFIRDNGITDENCFPYADSLCSCRNGSCNCSYSSPCCSNAVCSDRCPDWDSRLVTIDDTAPVTATIESIKQSVIERGPVSAAMGYGDRVGGYWDENHVYRCTDDEWINHGIVIAGYDDTEGYWIVKNSWGSSWEDGGYFKLGFGECAIESWPYYAAIATPTPTPSATPSPSATPTPTPAPLPGDANGDGVINAADITKIERIILELDPKTPGADANGDGEVDAADIGVIEYMMLGIWPWNHVHVEAPSSLPYDTHFTATVFITYVEGFGSAGFEVSYDASVLDLQGVTGGTLTQIDPGVSAEFHTIAIDDWGLVGGPGAVRINASIEGNPGPSGAGYLAQLHFHVIGSAGQSSAIAFNETQSWLRDSLGDAIDSTWAGDSVTVAP